MKIKASGNALTGCATRLKLYRTYIILLKKPNGIKWNSKTKKRKRNKLRRNKYISLCSFYFLIDLCASFFQEIKLTEKFLIFVPTIWYTVVTRFGMQFRCGEKWVLRIISFNRRKTRSKQPTNKSNVFFVMKRLAKKTADNSKKFKFIVTVKRWKLSAAVTVGLGTITKSFDFKKKKIL